MKKTASEIIDEKGGPKAFAQAMTAKGFVGFTPARVRVWKARDRFPKQFWTEIMSTYRDITASVLRETDTPDEA